MPTSSRSRRNLVLLIVAVAGCAAVIAGVVVLLGQVSGPIGPISDTEDGYVTQIACGNGFTGPPLHGVFTDIDADTGGPGRFQRMADTACSRAKTPERVTGYLLAGAGLLALLAVGTAGVARRSADRRAGETGPHGESGR